MEGSKQCPQCECTDVPANAEICPFCGYVFVEQTVAESMGKQDKPAVKAAEEKKPLEMMGISEVKKEETIQETGSQAIVTEGSVTPESTEYKTYQKKGIVKQTVAGTAPQEQGGKAAKGWLAASLAVAVLFMTCLYLDKILYSDRSGHFVWMCIAFGVMAGFLHVCCYANEKGSRRAGILGIIFGAGGLMFLYIRSCQEYYRGITFFDAFSRAYFFYKLPALLLIVIYAICWLTAAKFLKNKKGVVVFCVTAAELLLYPYIWMQDIQQFEIGRLAVCCVAMLVTDFLLYRVKSWLAMKPQRLFWIIYFIVIAAALVFLYGSREMFL